MNQFKELEYKYNAKKINLEDFLAFAEKLKYTKYQHVVSWDYYYTKDNNFIRFRDSASKPELTTKTKLDTENNFERIEIDLPLDRALINRTTVEMFVKSLGYVENFRIYKHCYIYTLPYVNFVYYIVQNKNLLPIDTFIEIEYNKEQLTEDSDIAEAIRILNFYDNKLKILGLTPENRLSKSLFELYKRN